MLEKLAPKARGIVVSDFVYGVVTPRILEVVHRLAEKHNYYCSVIYNAVARWGRSHINFHYFVQMNERLGWHFRTRTADSNN